MLFALNLLELLIDEMDSQTFSSPPDSGDQVTEFLDGLNLLLQVFALDEVAQLRVVFGLLVQIQQGLEKQNINTINVNEIMIVKLTQS